MFLHAWSEGCDALYGITMFLKRLLCLIAILSASVAHAASFDLSSKVVAYRLPNGMTWFLVPRPEVPVFSAIVMVKVGGVDEPANKTGLAHMFEHMAFKGSKTIGTKGDNEVWSIFNRNGAGDLNAFTSKDFTAYHASMPAAKLPLWLYMNSEMILHPVMRQFYQERDVVMEERRMRYDNSPMGFLLEQFTELAFPEGPYHWSPIGDPADLKTLTEEDAYAFHQKFYQPDRMVGAIVGDFDVDAVKKEIAKYWNSGENTAISKFKIQNSNSKISGEARKTIQFDAEPFLLMGFHKPAVPQRGDYQFDIFQGLLCNGRTARLEQSLVQQKHLATQVSCSNGYPGSRMDNLFIIGAAPAKGISLATLEAAVESELGRLTRDIAPEELTKVRKQIQADFYRNLQDNGELAEQLATTQTLTGDWNYLIQYSKVIASITVSELQKAAAHYFQPTNRVVVYRERGKK